VSILFLKGGEALVCSHPQQRTKPQQLERKPMPVKDRHDEALAVLRTVRDLLKDRGKWVHGSLARDRDGGDVQPHSTAAVRWCAAGAISKVAHQDSSTRYSGEVEWAAVRILERALNHSPYAGSDGIPRVNDGPNGYERIMAGLAKAIGVSPKRREAALKGWATRRHKAWLREMESASVDPRPEVMQFGGTIVASPEPTRELVAK
jgi:hypothetical protein